MEDDIMEEGCGCLLGVLAHAVGIALATVIVVWTLRWLGVLT